MSNRGGAESNANDALEPCIVSPSSRTIDEIEGHVARLMGAPSFVWHEMVSSVVHIDVHVILPTEETPHYTLFTTGMSDRPMQVPADLKDPASLQYAELLLMLPSDWFVDPRSVNELRDERKYWPIRLLKSLARFPHECETWLGFGHSVPNGDPPVPFADGTDMCCALLVPPVRVPSEFYELELSDGRSINFYAVVPLYPEELQLKLTRGTNALLDRFDKEGISELLEPKRLNTCLGWLDRLLVN
jgi:hypothetical protein